MTLKKLGRYELIRVLGRGAMGVVYEARDPNLDRRVAIKTVRVENLSDEAAAEYEHRFRIEARSAARLQHPNIVSVYDCDRDGDVAFLVMEYIQGDDLKYHFDRGQRYSLEQSLRLMRDLLAALDYAHQQGIVHRDIKPANLLIEPGGRLKLTDFGVARIQDSGEATRTQGNMVGTLKYMSPEQVQGRKSDSRADLFSAGVVLYQLLTDRRPFDGDNDFSIIHQIIGHTPPAPSSINARLPAAIDAVVARALAKDRDDRFATARDFALALQSAVRRAADPAVVPPAEPGKAAGSASNAAAGAASVPRSASRTTPGSAPAVPGPAGDVTQELELLYWKEIRDTDDPHDLQGFLERFPEGIYADLARRRLRKMVVPSAAADQTVLSGLEPPAIDLELEAPRAGELAPQRSGQAPQAGEEASQAPAVADAAESEVAAAQEASVAEVTVPSEVAVPTPVGSAESVAAPAASPDAPASRDTVAAPATPATPVTHQPRRALVVGVLAVVGAGIAAALFLGPAPAPVGSTSPALAAASAASPANPRPPASPASSAAVAAASPDSGSAMATAPAPAIAGKPVAAAASASAASAPRRAASRAAGRPAAAPASPPVAPPLARPAAPVTRDDAPRPAPAPQAVPAVAASVEQCRDRIFLSRELCLAEECARPGARVHPLCVKYREEKRLREEGKVRQAPQ